MGSRLSEVLDDCIARMNRGETLDGCLANHPKMRGQLEPLLRVASSVSAIPRVSPSDEFRRASKARLLARLREESVRAEAAGSGRRMQLDGEQARARQRSWRTTARSRRVTIPVTVALALILAVSLSVAILLNPLSSRQVIASPCILGILNGEVEVREAGSDGWQRGVQGVTLTAGTFIRTAQDSHAVLTFFEGSTIKLEPDTLVEIREIEQVDEQSTTIVLGQSVGRTWSHVVTMEPASYYEIETPSASVRAMGTLFATDVDETGLTKVATTEGLVNVAAQEDEVYVSANQQTRVEAGAAPSQPAVLPSPKAEFVITTDVPAVSSVSGPTGASTGHLPSGLSFNQITGSKSSFSSDGRQVITIARPVTGEYVVALRYTAQGTAALKVRTEAGGGIAFEHTERLAAAKGEGWLIRINLRVDDGLIVSAKVVGVEPLGDQVPEKVVETELARERAVPIEAITRDSSVIDSGAGDNVGEENTGDDEGDTNLSEGAGEKDTGSTADDMATSDDAGDEDIGDETGSESPSEDTADPDPTDNAGDTDISDDTGGQDPSEDIADPDPGDSTGDTGVSDETPAENPSQDIANPDTSDNAVEGNTGSVGGMNNGAAGTPLGPGTGASVTGPLVSR